MNLKQQLLASAFDTAKASLEPKSAHAAAHATLASFKDAGHAEADYPEWQTFVTMFSQQFRHCGLQKTASEQAAEAAAKKAALEEPKK